MEVGFRGGRVEGFTTSGGACGTAYDISLSAFEFRFLRLQMKKNRAMRSDIRMSPPITPPMIAPVGIPGEELDELPEGAVNEGVIDEVEDGASS